jgi:hypothetical protein
LFISSAKGYNNLSCERRMLTLEHVDPKKGVLVTGLKNEFNEILADDLYNYRKNNRFVPYRICDYPAPVSFGDVGEFLIGEEWVVCEFGGEIWWEESNRVGNSQVQKPFLGKKRTEEWKKNNSSLHRENWKTRDKTQIRELGKNSHKRNPTPGQIASAKAGRSEWRKHWSEDLFNEVENRYCNRTSYHWGRKELCEKYGVTEKTIENIVKHVREGKSYAELTRKSEGA